MLLGGQGHLELGYNLVIARSPSDAEPASPATARRVLLIAGIVVIGANLRPALSAVGPVLDPIRAEVGLSASAAGFLVGTLPVLTFAAVSPLVYPLVRRVGTDRALWLGLLALTAGIALRSLPVAALLWVGTVLLATGIAVGNVVLPGVVKRDFPAQIGSVTGIFSAAAGVIAAVASGTAVPLADALPGGWRAALGLWAGFALVAVALWTPRLATSTGTTSDIANQAVRGGPDEMVMVDGAGASPWHSPLAWQVAAFMALASAGFYAVITWYPTVLHDLGSSDVTAGWLLFVYQIVGVPVCLAVPLLLRRMANQRMAAAVAAAILAIGYLGLVLYPAGVVLWVVITGCGAGAAFMLALSFYGLRAADERSATALAGMAQTVAYLVAAASPLLFGVLRDVTGSWTLPLLLLVAVAAAQIVVAVRVGRDVQFRA